MLYNGLYFRYLPLTVNDDVIRALRWSTYIRLSAIRALQPQAAWTFCCVGLDTRIPHEEVGNISSGSTCYCTTLMFQEQLSSLEFNKGARLLYAALWVLASCDPASSTCFYEVR
jgi:hypothetical protein